MVSACTCARIADQCLRSCASVTGMLIQMSCDVAAVLLHMDPWRVSDATLMTQPALNVAGAYRSTTKSRQLAA